MEEERGYKYDVFISYPHEKSHREWVNKIFLPAFTLHLTNSPLGRSPDVFIDTEEIKPGDKWKPTLWHALARSRIMVPIWSINYFESPHCREECAIMLHREDRLGYSTQEQKGSLIVPVRFMDHKGYPTIANDFQQEDLRKYSRAEKGTGKAKKLERKIEKWVKNVAMRIDAAPEWMPVWLTNEWLDDPVARSEASKVLWPPRKIYYLESMLNDPKESDG